MTYKVNVWKLMQALKYTQKHNVYRRDICVNVMGTIAVKDRCDAHGDFKSFAPLSHYVEFIANDITIRESKCPEMDTLRFRIDEVMAAESYNIDIEVVE